MIRFVGLLIVTAVIMGIHPVAQSEPDARLAQPGDYIVVRSRFRECQSWENRVVLLRRVSPYHGTIDFLGLLSLDVRGKSAEWIRSNFLKAYQSKLPDRTPPPFRVEILDQISARLAGETITSLRHLLKNSCPGTIPLPSPTPSPEPHQDDYWYLAELQQLIAETDARRSQP